MSKKANETQDVDNEGVPLDAKTPAYKVGRFLADRFGMSLVLGCSDAKDVVEGDRITKNKVNAHKEIGRRAMMQMLAAGIAVPAAAVALIKNGDDQADAGLENPAASEEAQQAIDQIPQNDNQDDTTIVEVDIEQGSKDLIFSKGTPEATKNSIREVINTSLAVVLKNQKLQESFQDATVIFHVASNFHSTLASQPSLTPEMRRNIESFHGNACTFSGLRKDGNWYHHIIIDMSTFESLPETIVTLDHELGHLEAKESGLIHRTREAEEVAVFLESINRMADVINWMEQNNQDGSMDKHIHEFNNTILPRERAYLDGWRRQ